ncbi:MAG: hypothetical protein ACOY3I_04355 [Verrucomicrobiota bacterium]
MKRKPILVDCDGVLLNWEKGFADFLQSEYPHLLGDRGNLFEHSSASVLHEWMGLPSYQDARPLIAEFEESESYRLLEAFADAQAILPQLHREEWDIVVISHHTASDMERALSIKRETLVGHFGDIFKAIHCLPTSVSKETILSRYEPTYWIEDNRDNALLGIKCGHQPIRLVRERKENALTLESINSGKKLIVANSWHGIYKGIKIHRLPRKEAHGLSVKSEHRTRIKTGN